MFKIPENNERYYWTKHVIEKMKHYKLSPSRVKRVIRVPTRTEEGIVPDTIAAMQPAGTKRPEEIWVMYRVAKDEKEKTPFERALHQGKIRIITAWRYPGESPERDPIPEEILQEVRSLL